MSTKDRRVIQVSEPVYLRLTEMQRERQDQLKRQVSYSEVIERLLENAAVPS